MSRVLFAYECPHCRGQGVRRPARPGIDWPTPCPCEARTVFSQYQLGRTLEVSPRSIVAVHDGRARAKTCERVLERLGKFFDWPESPAKKPARRRAR